MEKPPAAAAGSSALWNPDLAPTRPDQRTWSRWHIAALWIGMAVCIPTYTLASGLLSQGLSWWGAILVILAGNIIVLVPMVLNAHPGARYGIPFPVLARASFGVRGANLPAVLRALVACGWFGIQTWFGGLALYSLAAAMAPELAEAPYLGGFLGLNLAQLVAFLLFWAINMFFVVRGMDSIRFFESWSAPLLIAIGLALLGWGFWGGGGPERVLAQAEQFSHPTVSLDVVAGKPVVVTLAPITEGRGEEPRRVRATEVRWMSFEGTPRRHELEERLKEVAWQPLAAEMVLPIVPQAPEDRVKLAFQLRSPEAPAGTAVIQAAGRARDPATPRAPGAGFLLGVLLPSLTAMVGYWATLSLNIPDFTRFAKSQRDQIVGQATGLPPTMAFYSFIGVAVTCASLIVFPDVLAQEDAPWDPVNLIAKLGEPVTLVIGMLGLSIATLTTNIAANVVSPANDFANLWPRRISFRTGGIITGVVGILMMPWKLLDSVGEYLFTWLIGYSALLGPVAGIMIADYYVVRRRELVVDDLYRTTGAYAYGGSGVNWRAIAILAVAVAPNVPGFLAAAGAVEPESIPAIFREFYTYAWFLGFGIGFGLYALVGVPRGAATRPA
jgi:cytosine/uracil/thiamine/allantoin permease